MSELITLREGRNEDAYALWLWANDPATRQASFGRPPIPWASHRAWLAEKLNAANSLVLIAETAEARPVGSVRFDADKSWGVARLSYVIAPEARGRGLSRPLVSGGVARLLRVHPGTLVRAQVLPSNLRSLRVFRGMGWQEQHDPGGSICFWHPAVASALDT